MCKSGANLRCFMRTLLCLCSLSLILVCGAAYAEPEEELIGPTPLAARQQAATPKSATEADTPELIRQRGAEWLKQCLKDWDAATHMTKKDWQRVCRRVSVERVNELIKQAKK